LQTQVNPGVEEKNFSPQNYIIYHPPPPSPDISVRINIIAIIEEKAVRVHISYST